MTLELTTSARYTTVAIALHWAIAISILAMIPFGWWMSDAVLDPATRAQAAQAFQLHKSVGLTILALSAARLIWRLLHKAPPLPQAMPAWEKTLAKVTHWMFYFAMIAIPLSGWVYTSAGYSITFERFFQVATVWFGLFEVPHIGVIASQSEEARKAIAVNSEFVHSKLAWVVLVLAGLHVAAALKHHLVDRDDVLTRMLPFLKPLRKVR